MKEKTYTVYVAFDGTEFTTKAACIEHERQEMISRVSAAQELCTIIDCINCPYYIPNQEHPNYCKFSGQTFYEVFDE